MLAEPHTPLPDGATNGNGQPDTPSRDHKGRFAAGNRMGRGNPFARQVAALRSRLLKRVTDDDLDAIADTLIASAKIGDLAAVKLLFSYVLGKPGEQPDPDRLDLDEWQLLQEGKVEPAERERLTETLSVQLALPQAKAALDEREAGHLCLAEGYTEDVAEKTARTRELFTEALRVYREQKETPRPVKDLFKVRAEAPRPVPSQHAPSTNGGNGHAGAAAEATTPANTQPEPRGVRPAPSPHGHNGHAVALAQLTSLFGGLTGLGHNGQPPSPHGDNGDGEPGDSVTSRR